MSAGSIINTCGAGYNAWFLHRASVATPLMLVPCVYTNVRPPAASTIAELQVKLLECRQRLAQQAAMLEEITQRQEDAQVRGQLPRLER